MPASRIPPQLIFVPALFVVDPAWAPAIVAGGLSSAARASPQDRNPARQIPVAISNAWFAVGPALVL